MVRQAAVEEEEEALLSERERVLNARRKPKEEVPVKSVILGVALLFIGLLFFLVCYLHHHGHMEQHIKEGSGLGLIILGTLTFLPGAYATWTAFAAWQGLLGYSYADIPKVD